MFRLRIVVRCSDARAARDAQSRLAEAGVEAQAVPGLATRLAPDAEDIVIVPAMDGGMDEAIAYLGDNSVSTRRPLALLAGLRASSPPPSGLDSHAPFTGAVTLDAPPALLAAQITAALRAGVAEEERVRRGATARALSADIPEPAEPRKLKALYIGAPSPHFLELERAIAQHAGLVAAAFTSFTGFDHLHDEHFDAVVLNGAKDPGIAISLCAALRRNATLHHLPTLVAVAPGDTATAKAAIDRGASCVTAERADSAAALGWLYEAVRRERRRKSAEHDVRALRDIMGDPRTGLFRRGPFEAHLARMADDHHSNGRAMSVVVLRVLTAHGAREPSDQIWRKGFNEIASLAGRLVRDTDSAAAFGRDIIAMALPATELKGGRRTAERVASVAECTAFASGESGAAPLIFEQSVAELQPGESGNALLVRAMGVFGAESETA